MILNDALSVPQRRYNISPGMPILGVVLEETAKRGRLFHWGLIHWYTKAKTNPRRLINVRLESLLERPVFRLLTKHRMLVPADAFFEWK